ncbi:MAG: alpha/beta fold hydrolase [Pseudomonadota bacterium]
MKVYTTSFVVLCVIAAFTGLARLQPALAQGVTEARPSAPLIVIPGILGSRLCDSTTGELVWGETLPTTSSLPQYEVERLRLAPNADPQSSGLTPCGIVETISAFRAGGAAYDPISIGPLRRSAYGPLLAFLSRIGYGDAPTDTAHAFHVFDYDWRLSNTVNAKRLAAFIDTVVTETGVPKVDILAHSMGGLVTRLYLQANPGHPIRHFIAMGTPHGGSTDMLKIAYEGLGFRKSLLIAGDVRAVALSWPSALQLMPAAADNCCFSGPNAIPFDPLDLDYWLSTGWLPGSLRAVSTQEGQAFRQGLIEAQGIRSQLDRPIDSVEVTLLAASKFGTLNAVTINQDGSGELQSWHQPGDGRVAYGSAINRRYNRQSVMVADRKHGEIFDGPVSQANLRIALLRTGEPPVTIPDQLVFASFNPNWDGAATINSLRLTQGKRAWKAGAEASLDFIIDYSAVWPSQWGRFQRRAQEGLAIRKLADIFANAVKSVCIETEGQPLCLSLSGKKSYTEKNRTPEEPSTRRVALTFSGPAPRQAGRYRVVVDQSVLPVKLTETVVVE